MKNLVINLDRATERWENYQSKNSGELTDICRVPAVDANHLHNHRQHLAPLMQLMHEPDKPNVTAATACFLGHIRCAQLIIEEDLPYALITEDDAEVLPGAIEFLEAYQSRPLPLDWLKLHVHRSGQRNRWHQPIGLTLNGQDIVVDMGGSKSTAAYILTNAGAKKVANMKRMIAPVDHVEWMHATQGVVFAQTRQNLFRVKDELGSYVSTHRADLFRRTPSLLKIELARRFIGRRMLKHNLAAAKRRARKFQAAASGSGELSPP